MDWSEVRKAYLLIVVVLGGCMAAILGAVLLIGLVASVFTPAPSPLPSAAIAPTTSAPSAAPASAQPTATASPPATASPTREAIASATPPDGSPAFPTMPPFPGPATLAVGRQHVVPSHVGGCWLVFFAGEQIIGESCGPDPFDLDAASTLIAPAAPLTFIAPDGWSFSSEALPGTDPMGAWRVTIAPVGDLDGLPTDRQETIYLSATGEALGSGQETTGTVRVVAPTRPGEYLLELRAYVSLDGWTWGAVYSHWRISIT